MQDTVRFEDSKRLAKRHRLWDLAVFGLIEDGGGGHY